MESLTQFRLFAVRLAIAFTLLAAVLLYPWAGRPASLGLVMGGIAGVLVFWVTARRLEKLARRDENPVYFVPVSWRVLGLVVYLAVLVRAYTLDQEGFSGFIACVAGLFIIRLAIIVLGLTGLDLPKQED